MPTEAAELVFDEATKVYPGRDGAAVDHLSLTVPAGEICVLVGPSGGGKTTALKLVNRLIPLTSGDIRIDGKSILQLDVTELRRGIGYVIQQVGLFPHQTIADNVATVPRLLGWPEARTRARVDELLALVGLEPGRFRARYPSELSGGERQRVGVARAIAVEPPLLLMDEPFGAVDPVVRERLQDELLQLHQRLGMTVLFVTHDVDEAIKLGNRIAVFAREARLAQYGPPAEILTRPANDDVARFVGADRLLKRLALVKAGELRLAAPLGDASRLPAVGGEASARDALAAILAAPDGFVRVVDATGATLGVLSLGEIAGLVHRLEPAPAR
jgi:osmoprotectant transport system ATP-binding protein